MYRVIQSFFDLSDGNREYHPGDIFPRNGLKVDDKRLGELASGNNRLGFPVIEKVEEQEEQAEPKARKRGRANVD